MNMLTLNDSLPSFLLTYTQTLIATEKPIILEKYKFVNSILLKPMQLAKLTIHRLRKL